MEQPIPPNTSNPKPGQGLRAFAARTPLGRAVSLLQLANKEAQARADAMLKQAAEKQKHEEQAKDDSKKELDAAAVLASRRHEGSDGRTVSRTESQAKTQETSCFSELDYSPLAPLERTANNAQLDIEQSLTGDLHRLGNTREQENRLIEIYANEHRGVTPIDGSVSSGAVKYQQFMHNVAVKDGREKMDRGQDTKAAILTDQRAFIALSNDTSLSDTDVKDAFIQTSPNAADLNEEQQQQYLDQVSTLGQQPVKDMEMFRNGQGGRGGRSGADNVLVFQPNHHLAKTAPTEREEKMYEAEFTDLVFHRSPGEKISPAAEYKRQLGEQIRMRGRDNLELSKDECRESDVSSDQLIAGRMYIAGHSRENIEVSITKHSPRTAINNNKVNQKLDNKAYIQEEIKPVFNHPFVQGNRLDVHNMTVENNVPSGMNRFDCIERITAAVDSKQWDSKSPERTCPGYVNEERTNDSDLEPPF